MQKLEQLILPIVLLSVLAIKAGDAIECFVCDSSINEDCEDLSKSSLKPVTCKTSILRDGGSSWLKELTRIDFFETSEVVVPMVCQTLKANDAGGKEFTFRGCQLDGGKSEICETLENKVKKDKSVTIVSCSICKEDGCNGAATSIKIISIWLLLVPIALVKIFV